MSSVSFTLKGNVWHTALIWYMGGNYSLPDNELQDVLKLTDWSAQRLGAIFPAIDVAKTASGE